MAEHNATFRAANTHIWLARRFIVECACGFRCDRHFKSGPAARCAVRHDKAARKAEVKTDA